MPESGEGAPKRAEIVNIQEGIRKEIAEVNAIRDEAEKNQAKEALKIRLEDELRQVEHSAQDALNFGVEKRPDDAKEVKISLIRVLEGVKAGIIELPPGNSNTFLSRLAEEGITDRAAASLYGIVSSCLSEEITFSPPGGNPTPFEIFLSSLSNNDPQTARIVIDCLIDKAAELGMTEDQAREKFKDILQARKADKEDVRQEQYFEQEWQYYYKDFLDEKDREIVRSFYTPADFLNWVSEVKNEVVTTTTLTGENLDREVSNELERKLVGVFSKIFLKTDRETPREPFEKIVTQGYMYNIQSAYQLLLRRLDSITLDLGKEGELVGEALGDKDKGFWLRFSKEKIDVKDVEMKNLKKDKIGKKNVLTYSVSPVPGSKEVGLVEFLEGVRIQAQHKIDTKEFLHNIRYLFYQGAGEKGFWPQVAGYAEQMISTDIDGIMLLPDSDIFMSAFRLYTKYLEEEFAMVDWIHQPTMFSRDFMKVTSRLEQQVLKDLKIIFKDRVGDDEWRLREALSMGIGLSKGIFLTEPELAAWADPHVDRKGGKGAASYTSYYTNDNVALNALNPLHHFLRWQAEGVIKGPLLFAPVDKLDEVAMRYAWDHSKLWDQMNQFMNSFVEGRKTVGDQPDRQKLLVEILPNFGRGGSIVTRGAWRNTWGFRDWLIYEEGETLDHLESWKALENIGFEAVLYYAREQIATDENFLVPPRDEEIERKVDEEISKGKLEAKDRTSEIDKKKADRDDMLQKRNDFFKHLYKNYINKDFGLDDNGIEQALENELSNLMENDKEIKYEINRRIKKGMLNKEKDEKKERQKDAIQSAAYKRIMMEALTGILKDRLPTKFVRLERDRFTDDGKRLWLKIMEEMNKGEEYGEYSEHTVKHERFTPEEFNGFMRDLMLVENVVRSRVTREMNDYLKTQKVPNLSRFTPSSAYKIDEKVIEDILRSTGDQEKKANIPHVKKLYRTINSFMNEDFMNEFAIKLDRKDFPFAIAAEELETSFMAVRGGGEKVLKRVLGDTANIETRQFEAVKKLLEVYKHVAVDPKRDISEIIKTINEIRQVADELHGPAYANELAHHFSVLTIAYFRKDTAAINFFTKLFRVGKPNSLAARMQGTLRGVWEWDVNDIVKFVEELERARILPKEPYDLKATTEGLEKVPRLENFLGAKFLGFEFFESKIGKNVRKKMAQYTPENWFTKNIWNKLIYKEVELKKEADHEFSGYSLRQEVGATGKQITWEIINKYLPIFIAVLLFAAISTALKETEGKKQ